MIKMPRKLGIEENFLNLKKNIYLKKQLGNFLVVQWLGLQAFTTERPGSIRGWGTKIPQAPQCGPHQKKQKTKTNQPINQQTKTAKIILNSEKLDIFLLRSGASQEYLLLPLLFKIGLESNSRRLEKKIKVIQIGKEEIKPSFFADNMIVYVENSNNSLLDL